MYEYFAYICGQLNLDKGTKTIQQNIFPQQMISTCKRIKLNSFLIVHIKIKIAQIYKHNRPFVCLFLFFETGVSLCSPSSAVQTDLKLTDLPGSASWVLGLKACITTKSLSRHCFVRIDKIHEKSESGRLWFSGQACAYMREAQALNLSTKNHSKKLLYTQVRGLKWQIITSPGETGEIRVFSIETERCKAAALGNSPWLFKC